MAKKFEGDENHRIAFGLREPYRTVVGLRTRLPVRSSETKPFVRSIANGADLDKKFDNWFDDNWSQLFAVKRDIEIVQEQSDRIVISIPFK